MIAASPTRPPDHGPHPPHQPARALLAAHLDRSRPGAGARALSVWSPRFSRRVRTRLRAAGDDHRRRERHRQVDPAGGHRHAHRFRRGRRRPRLSPRRSCRRDRGDRWRAGGGAEGVLAAAPADGLVLQGGELFFRRPLSRPGRARRRTPAGFPLPFARRRVFALLLRALPAPGDLHIRRAGIGAVAGAPDRLPSPAPPHGPGRPRPGHPRHPFAAADELPGATLLAATPRGFAPTTLEQTSHFRLLRDYAADPHGFVRQALADEDGADEA